MFNSIHDQKIKNILLFTLSSLFIMSLGVILYFKILHGYFIRDDYEYIPLLKGLNLQDSFRVFMPIKMNGIVLIPYYRPLVVWTFWIDTLFSTKPFIFHLTSLLSHLVNTLMVSYLTFLLFNKKISLSFLAGLLFITFPFHPEAVSWIAARYDLLVTTLLLATIISTVLFIQTKNKFWTFALYLAYALAMLCKETAVVIPLITAVIITAFSKKTIVKTLFVYKNIFIILFFETFAYYFLRSYILSSFNIFSNAEYRLQLGLSRIFAIYIIFFIILVFIRILLINKIKIISKPEKILWMLFLILGLVMLPTSFVLTTKRYLYAPSAILAVFFAGSAEYFINLFKKSTVLYSAIFSIIIIFAFIDGKLLLRSNNQWLKAAYLAERISDQITEIVDHASPSDTLYFINLPSKDGQMNIFYIAGTDNMIKMHTGKKIPKIVITPLTGDITSTIPKIIKNNLYLESKYGFERPNVQTADYTTELLDNNNLVVKFKNNIFKNKNNKFFVYYKRNIKEL